MGSPPDRSGALAWSFAAAAFLVCDSALIVPLIQPITNHSVRLHDHTKARMNPTSTRHTMSKFFSIGLIALAAAGCSSLKTPATADVAVSNAAVSNAAAAGAAQYAPLEMNSAQEKLALSKKALEKKDYQLARDLANQAQADAKLAQSKAGSAKAQSAANALQDDIRVLREELDRNSK